MSKSIVWGLFIAVVISIAMSVTSLVLVMSQVGVKKQGFSPQYVAADSYYEPEDRMACQRFLRAAATFIQDARDFGFYIPESTCDSIKQTGNDQCGEGWADRVAFTAWNYGEGGDFSSCDF